MSKNHPDARLTTQGEIVSFDGGVHLPNYSGLVYACLEGNSYILWAYPPYEQGKRKWAVVNSGSVVVQSALDKFIKENTNGN